MTIICYDISNDKTRLKLSKYLVKHGRRIQNSVFEINQTAAITSEVIKTIKIQFSQRLKKDDSILIIPILPVGQKNIIRMGTKVKAEKAYITIVS